MRKNQSIQKDGHRKLRETIKQLKSEILRLRKENQTMLMQLLTLESNKDRVKKREAEKVVESELTLEQKASAWRQDFIKRYKKGQ